jgi:hypothetical protein
MEIPFDDDDDIFSEPLPSRVVGSEFARCEMLWGAYCSFFGNPPSRGPLTDWSEVVTIAKEYDCDVSFPLRIVFDAVRYYTLRSSTGHVIYRKQFAGKFLRSCWERFLEQVMGADISPSMFANIEGFFLYMEMETVFKILRSRGVDLDDLFSAPVEDVLCSWVLTCSSACRVAICPSDRVLKKFGYEFREWVNTLPTDLRSVAFDDVSGFSSSEILSRIALFEKSGDLELPSSMNGSRKGARDEIKR